MSLPTFGKPPVTEVACGVQFNPATPFRTVDFGLFWEHIRKEYPDTSDQPPLPEIPEPGLAVPQARFEMFREPPLRRVWMISQDKARLIQLQDNRFHYNWRRVNESDPYPRFEAVSAGFLKEWLTFETWAKSARIGQVRPLRYELTYVNLVTASNGLKRPGSNYEFLRFFTPISGRLLKDPELMNGELLFRLPGEKGTLSVNVKQGIKKADNSPVLNIELTARGNAQDVSLADWLKVAHEWIVVGFVDITTENAHKEWGLE
ncbi:MAG: TIGR04255 family protein [Planctomycetota bacterium]|nr:TIGR04255 family protein [Planctomycetota bacterium]